MTAKELGLEVVNNNGEIFVVDYGKKVKSQHATLIDAEMFVSGLVAKYNNNIN